MRNCILITASLLCSLIWISVSGLKSQTVEVQSGDEVTLQLNRSEPRCISHMFRSFEPATFCSGFKDGKFNMTSNISTVFLNIKQVDLSDSGLYFCGYYLSRYPLIVDATFLEVQAGDRGPGRLVVVMVMIIICLSVKIKWLHKGNHSLIYSAVTFRPKTERNLRPDPNREEDKSCIHSGTR
uniref:Immunoglobulin subtype domain-containing protein n=1 Tax=Labrus bergylta TaxID=56723 RepID=A0A3Q3E5A3_9LABR